MSRSNPFSGEIELVPERLSFSITNSRPHSSPKIRYFSIDNDPDFQYQPFFSDFGPLSLLHVHKFYVLVSNNLRIRKDTKYHFITTNNPNRIANAVFISSAFRMIYLRLSPEESLQPFSSIIPSLKPYRDASSFPSTYDLTVLSCLQGIKRAMNLNWYYPHSFNPIEWEENEIVASGDMNWLIPGKLMAFASPHDRHEIQPGWFVATPADLVPKFRGLGINHVIRLSKKFYDEKVFTANGIKHTELFFPDGTIPPLEILLQFLKIIEGNDIVALHCKAGLGRTGTLAGCHMIKNFRFTAAEAIGWIRVCRPGSVIGPQQQYLIAFHQNLRVPAPSSSSHHLHSPNKALRKTPRREKDDRTSTHKSSHVPETPQVHKTKTLAKDDDLGAVAVRLFASTPKHPQPRKYRRAVV